MKGANIVVTKRKNIKIISALLILAASIVVLVSEYQFNKNQSISHDISRESTTIMTTNPKTDFTKTTNDNEVTTNDVRESLPKEEQSDIGDSKVTADPRGNGAFIGSGVFTKTYKDVTVEDFDSDTKQYTITHKGPNWQSEIEADKNNQ